MPDIPNTTRAQTIFLRAFRTNPGGPPPSLWPTPAILRKWLRRPGFLRALNSILDTLRFQSDFHLANANRRAKRFFILSLLGMGDCGSTEIGFGQ